MLHPAPAMKQMEEMLKRRCTSATPNLGLKKPPPGSAGGGARREQPSAMGGRAACRSFAATRRGPGAQGRSKMEDAAAR